MGADDTAKDLIFGTDARATVEIENIPWTREGRIGREEGPNATSYPPFGRIVGFSQFVSKTYSNVLFKRKAQLIMAESAFSLDRRRTIGRGLSSLSNARFPDFLRKTKLNSD